MITTKANIIDCLIRLFAAYRCNIISSKDKTYRLSDEEQNALFVPLEDKLDSVLSNLSLEDIEAYERLVLTLAIKENERGA